MMSETQPEKLSISALAERFEMDRATVSKRLSNAPFERGPKNSKVYSVEDIAELLTAEEDSPELEAAKLRRAVADAEKAELTVAKMRGELVNRVEVITEVQGIFAGLYQKVCIHYVRRNAGRLHKIETNKELAEVLQNDLMEIFNEIADENSIENGDSQGDTD